MANYLSATPLYDFIDECQRLGIGEPRVFMQVVMLLMSAAIAGLLSRFIRPNLRRAGEAHWKTGSEALARLMYPLLFWLIVELVTVFWRGGHSVTLMRLCASLLFALVIVRAMAYLLQAVFETSGWIDKVVRPLAWLVWTIFALHISGVLPTIQDALESIVFPLGKQHVSLMTILNGIALVAVTLLIALWLGRLLERRVMAATSLNLSFRVVATKVIRTILVVAGVMIALPLVGIDLTVLSVFGGAVGVGLGFGLQKIASNYVSGFIILLDGSVRIGDIVNIDGRQGSVSSITSRYVLLKLADGTEAIIPNETLITSTVLNLSHTDNLVRVAMPVQVAYGTDLEQAGVLLTEAASTQARVLTEPAPAFFIKQFATNGIDIELAFWIKDPDQGSLALRSDINLAIWKAFSAHGIEIPFPRQEVQIVGGNPARASESGAGSSER